jgi:hypothetical protein
MCCNSKLYYILYFKFYVIYFLGAKERPLSDAHATIDMVVE